MVASQSVPAAAAGEHGWGYQDFVRAGMLAVAVGLAAFLTLAPWSILSGGAVAPPAVMGATEVADRAKLAGLLAVLALWALLCLIHRSFTFRGVFTGGDHRPSTSQFQFYVWTTIVIYAYVALFVARSLRGIDQALGDLPPNVLVASGFSLLTLAGAKAITRKQVDSGTIVKTAAAETTGGAAKPTTSKQAVPSAASLDWLITDDGGNLDLTKVQLLAWTMVAAVVYLFHVWAAIGGVALNAAADQCGGQLSAAQQADCGALPDIDGALMVLMGLGMGTYLGTKLITTTTPQVTQVVPLEGDETSPITLTGVGFGDQQGGSLITLDGYATTAPVQPPGWSATQVCFTLPLQHPNGKPWSAFADESVQLGVLVDGQRSNTASFTFRPSVGVPATSGTAPASSPTQTP